MKLEKIGIYPVKSTTGTSLQSATVEARGLRGDRRWVITDADGITITARDTPTLALLQADLITSGLRLSAKDHPALDVPLPAPNAPRRDIRVWSDTVNAQSAGRNAGDWLTQFLGHPAQLYFMDDLAERPVENHDSALVSFADSHPLLLTTTASLGLLNERAELELDMRRFRPNVVVAGADAFEEDRWRRVRIGAIEFEVTGPCERCSFTTLDPDTAQSHPEQEPLRTLATFRRSTDGNVCFGQMLVPVAPGEIRIGDAVTVLETGRPRPEPGS